MADPPADDAAIIRQSRESPEAFALLYDRYAADIHRYAARRPGEEAADRLVRDAAGRDAAALHLGGGRCVRPVGPVRHRGACPVSVWP